MILPIYAFGTRVLKKQTSVINQDHMNLQELIQDMWTTMYNASGVGLAAPQVGHSIRLFIVDTTQLAEEGEEKGIKQVFINPVKIAEEGALWSYEEGCLSIPDIRGDIDRLEEVTLQYVDETFKAYEKTFTGIEARVIQHEYDHLDGILFTDRLKPVKKRRVKRKLDSIKKGLVEVSYPMRFN